MKYPELYEEFRTHQDFLRYLMFETTKKRVIKEDGWVYVKKFSNGEAIASAIETITGADMICLIAIIQHIFDNQHLTAKSIMNTPPSKKHPNGQQETLLSIVTSLSFILKHYINHNDKALLIKTLERLRTYQVAFKITRKGVYSSYNEHYLRKCVIDGDEVIITISEALFQLINTETQWTINYTRLCSFNGITQALYMFLVQNTGNVFKQDTLKNLLGLTEVDFKNRDTIKQALTRLKPSYLKSFEVIKKGKGDYSFSLVRKFTDNK